MTTLAPAKLGCEGQPYSLSCTFDRYLFSTPLSAFLPFLIEDFPCREPFGLVLLGEVTVLGGLDFDLGLGEVLTDEKRSLALIFLIGFLAGFLLGLVICLAGFLDLTGFGLVCLGLGFALGLVLDLRCFTGFLAPARDTEIALEFFVT